MARIRTIKPDFWTDGNIVALSPFARLLFIGMWNFTMCDHGHVADDAVKLKLQVLPMDNVDIHGLLAEIMESGRVTRVTDPDGRTYLHVTRFEDHQKIDPRWKTRCPACASPGLTETHPRLVEAHRDSPELTQTHPRKGREGKGTTTSTAARTDDPEGFAEFWAIYPRREGKRKAAQAFRAALKRADLQAILEGAKRYADVPREPQYVAMPTTWLNADRWDDEPMTKSGAPAPGSGWDKGLPVDPYGLGGDQ